MRYLQWTEHKMLLGKYSIAEKFFKTWMWNCNIQIEYFDELFRFFYETDTRTPSERLRDHETYID